MPLINLILILAILGVVAWLVWRYLPLPEPFKTLLQVVIVVVAILVLLDWAGLLHMTLAHAATHSDLYLR